MCAKVKVKVNPVYLDYLDKPQFTQIYYGGSSSGKSYFLAQKIVLDNLKGVNWLICRNVANTLRRSSFNEIVKAIINMDLISQYHINKSDMVITCKLNNRQILFAGLDDNGEKIKSVTPADSVLHRIFIEEATEVKREAYKQLTKRLRGRSEFSKCVILAFNPILRSHWIYKEFFSKWKDDKTSYEDENLCILKTTYKDNLFLTDDDRKQLEDETDPYYYQVYSLGNFGILGDVIYRNWKIDDLTEYKKTVGMTYIGLDFGWQHPTAAIKVSIDTDRKKIYILDEIYQSGMTTEQLAERLRTFAGNQYIWADSAEPRSINALNNLGIRAQGVKKGTDSIISGIKYIQQFEIIIDVSCQNFKNEIEQYHWQQNKDGESMEVPVKKQDDAMDAFRYALSNYIDGSSGRAVSNRVF